MKEYSSVKLFGKKTELINSLVFIYFGNIEHNSALDEYFLCFYVVFLPHGYYQILHLKI